MGNKYLRHEFCSTDTLWNKCGINYGALIIILQHRLIHGLWSVFGTLYYVQGYSFEAGYYSIYCYEYWSVLVLIFIKIGLQIEYTLTKCIPDKDIYDALIEMFGADIAMIIITYSGICVDGQCGSRKSLNLPSQCKCRVINEWYEGNGWK